MDLVAGIRKSGSRGGVNFSWDDVATSAHRENYLGHSLKAPVGRWQKGRDLNWYAKADGTDSTSNETSEERAARERKEELRKVKEAEEDALARALGLPVASRNVTGANAVELDNPRTQPPTSEAEGSKPSEGRHGGPRHSRDSERRHRRRHRSRSPESTRFGDRDRRRDRSPRRGRETHHHRSREEKRDRDRRRNDSRDREARLPGESHGRSRNRSRSVERSEYKQGHRDDYWTKDRDRRRSRSPQHHR